MSTEPRLKGKVCVISGANRGFGQAIAIRFVEEGGKVVCLSRSGCDDTLKLIGQIEGFKGSVDDVAINGEALFLARRIALSYLVLSLTVKCDISNEDMVKNVYAVAAKKWGPNIDVLVNNAALFIFESVETAKPEDWDKACSVCARQQPLLGGTA